MDVVCLDVATTFTFLTGASHPDQLVYRKADLDHRAIAVTYRTRPGGLFGRMDARSTTSPIPVLTTIGTCVWPQGCSSPRVMMEALSICINIK